VTKKVNKSKGTVSVSNPSRPESAGPTHIPSSAKVIVSIELPPYLSADEKANLEIIFSPNIDYCKLRFELKNENLVVSFGGKINKDCTYEFDFVKDDDRKKSFEVQARTIEKDTNEPINIFYSATRDTSPIEGEVRWLLLKPVPKFGEGNALLKGLTDSLRWILHQTRRLRGTRWYVLRYSIILTAGAIALFYFNVLPSDDIKKWLNEKSEYIQIKWIRNKPPLEYTGEWPNLLEAGPDGRPKSSVWSSVPKEWAIVNNSLHIKGNDIGFVKTPLDIHAPYKYTVSFRLIITAGQRAAAWAVRAKDGSHYYLFVLNLPPEGGKGAKLDGFICHGEKCDPLQNAQETPTNIGYNHLEAGDLLTVKVEAVNGEMKHTITLTLDKADGNPNARYFDSRPFYINFFDAENLYPYGTVGFKSGAEENVVVIDQLSISNIK
jgi:hypothetical protein